MRCMRTGGFGGVLDDCLDEGVWVSSSRGVGLQYVETLARFWTVPRVSECTHVVVV